VTKSRNILPPRHKWTDYEVAQLRKLYPDLLTATVAEALGLPARTVYSKANGLGIKKSEAFYEAEAARARHRGNGAGTRFQKGLTPWNKGMKGLNIGGAATRFAKGGQPHNTRPVGSYRFSAEGYLQQKVSAAQGNNSQRWRAVHELVWVAANGPVPAGHICVFKPGMKTTELEAITADKVDCIARAENMRRNSYHTNLPKEVAQLVQLRGALLRQINRRKGAEQ